jgi:uncharacterized membrane-anchored protein
MKHLSRWARNNKWKARLIMTIAWFLLTALAIIIGTTLTGLSIELPSTYLLISVAVFFAAIFYYPLRSQKSFYSTDVFYIKQKSCDLVLAVCSFCLILYAANKPGTLFQHYGNLYAATVIEPSVLKDSTSKSYKSIKDFSASMKNEDGKMLKWKERKKLLKQQVKAIKKSPDMSNGEKTLLTIISVLLALGLLYLVAALACNLSCNGSEAAAVIVGIGGAGLVVFLLILAIRGIYGKKKKRKQQAEFVPER